MPSTDALKETLEHFRERESKLLAELEQKNPELVAELQRVRVMIRSIQGELGESANGELGVWDSPSIERPVAVAGRKPDIRIDEFTGMSQAEAAREYLRKIGHAIAFEELAEALQKGGCKVSGANAKKVLYISLIRNARDFHVPQKGYIGLREFYPKLSQQRAEAKKDKAHPRKKARTGGRRRRASKEAAKEQPEAEQ